MKSRASFKSHPIHPMLVGFPIAFMFGAFGFHLAGLLQNRDDWVQIGDVLTPLAIITALIAAIPGFIDYFTVVPPKSSAKQRATYHMVINLIAVGIFTLSYFLNDQWQLCWVTTLQAAGIIFITAGGWLGGTLVFRNQIGVDHRYANKGKWQEASFGKSKAIEIAKVADLQTGQMKLLHVDGKRIVLGKTENGYVAFDDRCTHKGASLADGALVCVGKGGVVQCPWHGSQFDVQSGACHAGPAKKAIKTYSVQQQGDAVMLEL